MHEVQLNAETVLERIARIHQSNAKFNLVDGRSTVKVWHYRPPGGSGRLSTYDQRNIRRHTVMKKKEKEKVGQVLLQFGISNPKYNEKSSKLNEE